MKDNFSTQSNQYAKFRPDYPSQLYDFILPMVKNKQTAWDCGTGNGQVAKVLSNYFDQVYATDISEKQLSNAYQEKNIIYKVESAESTSLPDHSFDLITVAQAIHWFDFEKFYHEVRRTIKPEGILAVIGYGLLKTEDQTDEIINHFYNNIIGTYWDKERRYIDENYNTIPFPFKEIKIPTIYNEYEWNIDQLMGYFETWSAVQHYIKSNHQNPMELIYNDIKKSWGNKNVKTIKFPILTRIAHVNS